MVIPWVISKCKKLARCSDTTIHIHFRFKLHTKQNFLTLSCLKTLPVPWGRRSGCCRRARHPTCARTPRRTAPWRERSCAWEGRSCTWRSRKQVFIVFHILTKQVKLKREEQIGRTIVFCLIKAGFLNTVGLRITSPGDVEGNAETHVRRSLVQLARELTVSDVELKVIGN